MTNDMKAWVPNQNTQVCLGRQWVTIKGLGDGDWPDSSSAQTTLVAKREGRAEGITKLLGC